MGGYFLILGGLSYQISMPNKVGGREGGREGKRACGSVSSEGRGKGVAGREGGREDRRKGGIEEGREGWIDSIRGVGYSHFLVG